ncbi:hypothetical protein LTS18_009685 [Coniosporium uncinatum]|uniref:Uncharacterized protein n=1 Tax=Coniosporium uncinatum TaxID=93489 RepID=A0ACC3D085_9PEZI|nr:hypothetical protein LTS18_009685 [Coniosporium uncinatum]
MVAAILAVGAVGSTATVIRIPFVGQLSNWDDFLWNTTDVAIWSTVEPGIGITCCCIATLRPLLKLLLHKAGLRSSSQGQRVNSPSFSDHKPPRMTSNRISDATELEDFAPHSNTTTVTTITGNARRGPINDTWRIRRDDQGRNAINKSVMVATLEEAEKGDDKLLPTPPNYLGDILSDWDIEPAKRYNG